MADREEAIDGFQELTSSSREQATEYLSNSAWNLETAVTAYFADMEETSGGLAGASESTPAAAPEYTGPRTLDGRPAPEYAQPSSSRSSSKSAQKKPQRRGVAGVATLGSLANNNDEDDDSDDEDDHGRGDLFAGGEKSGLAVRDPTKSSDPHQLIKDILAKAKANSGAEPVTPDPRPSASSSFRGSGQTLGGDGTESRTIPDPAGSSIPTFRGPQGPPQERILHLWADGFSIDDGELRRFDDPSNAQDLQMIRNGRAPLHLMNVQLDQPVDVKLQQHKEAYHPLPKIYRPFGGAGQRLGSPVPGTGSSTPPSAPAAAPSATSSSSTPAPTVDESQPTLTIRIQLPNGTRLPARFNATNTVGDVYEFVQRASPETNNRAWVLATTFPNKDHTDKSLVLGEMIEFKKGGTAVVKWA